MANVDGGDNGSLFGGFFDGALELVNGWFQYDIAKEQAKNNSTTTNTPITTPNTPVIADYTKMYMLFGGGLLLILLILLLGGRK